MLDQELFAALLGDTHNTPIEFKDVCPSSFFRMSRAQREEKSILARDALPMHGSLRVCVCLCA